MFQSSTYYFFFDLCVVPSKANNVQTSIILIFMFRSSIYSSLLSLFNFFLYDFSYVLKFHQSISVLFIFVVPSKANMAHIFLLGALPPSSSYLLLTSSCLASCPPSIIFPLLLFSSRHYTLCLIVYPAVPFVYLLFTDFLTV